ncbi:MAG: glycosyltransferase family 2 protein, partial [Planctomycetota bacterium]
MTLETLALVVFCLAAVPAMMTLWNLLIFRAPRQAPADRSPAISVLIPARNEQDNIARVVESACASRGVELEVIVLDDHSDDGTAEVVRQLAARHPEVHLRQAPPLPDGFNGKQHACSVLAGLASNDILVFVDADVRLHERALADLAAHMERHGLDLVSGFPRQLTGSLGERLLIGLIHVVLLGFLPIAWMRKKPS